eukprot:3100394-Amphidinium_carterae.1
MGARKGTTLAKERLKSESRPEHKAQLWQVQVKVCFLALQTLPRNQITGKFTCSRKRETCT